MPEEIKFADTYHSGSKEFKQVKQSVDRTGPKLEKELTEDLVLSEANPKIRGWLRRTENLEGAKLEQAACFLTTIGGIIDQFEDQMTARISRRIGSASSSQEHGLGLSYFCVHSTIEAILGINKATGLIKKPAENFVIKHSGDAAYLFGRDENSQPKEGYIRIGDVKRDFFPVIDSASMFIEGNHKTNKKGNVLLIEKPNPYPLSERSELFLLGNEAVSKYLRKLFDLYVSKQNGRATSKTI